MDAKAILVILLTASASLEDARRWYDRGREAMAKCHPQRGAGDARENCAPRMVDGGIVLAKHVAKDDGAHPKRRPQRRLNPARSPPIGRLRVREEGRSSR